ncbi:MAG: zinc-binding alcohol dehydrogenase [Clostridia bacterium]|nr:zinc-binding alcohol dehydrogenase [Clostridia bacterium]
MKNVNILFTSPGVAELVEKEMPTYGEDEVLVKIVTTTVSAGTERANLIGDPNVAGRRAPEVKFPRQSGYSAGAEVVAVGDKVTRVKVGDRVACSWTKHAQYCVLKETQVYRLPDVLSYEEAALVHIATFPMAAIRKCRLEVGESAIVMGQGVLGLIAVELLRVAGAAPIIAVDPVPEKRALALTLGADYALDPFAEGFADTVKCLTGGKGAKVAIEVTGLGSGLDMVLDCMAKFGRVALLGCTRNSDFTIDYYRKVHCPGITLVGAHTMARPKLESSEDWWTELDDAEAIIRLVELGRLDLKRLIEETYSPADAPAVYDRLAKNSAFPIVQFDWRRLS